MDQWYYAREGNQNGPISRGQLASLAANGGLDPVKDLVWNSSMKDWTPAGEIEGLFIKSANLPVADPSNPYATPASAWNSETQVTQVATGEALTEIAPGSEPIDVMACLKRAFELTKRHFGMILLLTVVYLGVAIAVGALGSFLDAAAGFTVQPATTFEEGSPEGFDENFSKDFAESAAGGGLISNILSQLLSVFLSLGVARIGLNIVSGREFSVGTLFSGGPKFLPALGATILYGLMVIIGLVLLIVPGIYLALRYGQFINGMVDRDLGVFDSFKYSSSITTNNRGSLLGLAFMGLLVMLAGVIAFCVGLFFAMPVAWLSWIVAFRWMQYGHRATLDQPGTKTPMLAKNEV